MNAFNRVFGVPRKVLEALPHNAEHDPAVNRWVRIATNDAANVPIGLLMLYLAAAHGTLSPAVLIPLTWTFVAARFAHTACYALALQPWRTAAYSVGSIAVIVAAGSVVVQ